MTQENRLQQSVAIAAYRLFKNSRSFESYRNELIKAFLHYSSYNSSMTSKGCQLIQNLITFKISKNGI